MGVIRDKREILDTMPHEQLLAAGVPEITFYNINGAFHALCPFHGDHHLGSFAYNPHTGIWKCFACGVGGKGVVPLLMKLHKWSYCKAVDYMYEHRNDPVTRFPTAAPQSIMPKGSTLRTVSSRPQPKADTQAKLHGINLESDFTGHDPLSPLDVDRVYAAFAAASPLTNYEKDRLRAQRGITFADCSDFFRFPSNWDHDFWTRFRHNLQSYDHSGQDERLYHSLIGVPGFYWDVAESRPGFVAVPNALGILDRGADGLIIGIEIRRKNDDGPRYIGFSSVAVCARDPERYKYGAKAGFVDVVPRLAGNQKNCGIAVTEGKFKALHLAHKGYTAINIRGICNWRDTLPILKQLADGQPVTIAFDADMKKKASVAQAAADFAQALIDGGYDVQFLSWPLCYGKGFDDLCNNGYYYKTRITPGQRYLDTTLFPILRKSKQASA